MKNMCESECSHCSRELVKINGRTLRAAIDSVGASFNKKFRLTDWVSVCPVCNCYALGIDTYNPWPFLCKDGVMRVTTDFDHNELEPAGEVLSFAGFKFSRAAFNSSVISAGNIDSSTAEVEQLGQRFLAAPSSDSAFQFSHRVCEWGRGHRVWGNLNRFHTPQELGSRICDWISQSLHFGPREAISIGAAIKGLGVSFASKHLRMAFPDRFGVLDEVISEGFGLALNEAGYHLFHELLRDFQRVFAPDKRIAEIEMGLFLLVRQGVRAST